MTSGTITLYKKPSNGKDAASCVVCPAIVTPNANMFGVVKEAQELDVELTMYRSGTKLEIQSVEYSDVEIDMNYAIVANGVEAKLPINGDNSKIRLRINGISEEVSFQLKVTSTDSDIALASITISPKSDVNMSIQCQQTVTFKGDSSGVCKELQYAKIPISLYNGASSIAIKAGSMRITENGKDTTTWLGIYDKTNSTTMYVSFMFGEGVIFIAGLVGFKGALVEIKLYDGDENEAYTSINVDVSKQGEQGDKGDKGDDGRTFTYCPTGTWQINHEYNTIGDNYMQIDICEVDGEQYKCLKTHTSSIENKPKSSNSDWHQYWEKISYIKNVATDMVIADGGNIGGFSFSRKKDSDGNDIRVDGVVVGVMQSLKKEGNDPILSIDSETGKIEARDGIFKGNIICDTGTFKNITTPNNSFKIDGEGNITATSGNIGNMTIGDGLSYKNDYSSLNINCETSNYYGLLDAVSYCQNFDLFELNNSAIRSTIYGLGAAAAFFTKKYDNLYGYSIYSEGSVLFNKTYKGDSVLFNDIPIRLGSLYISKDSVQSNENYAVSGNTYTLQYAIPLLIVSVSGKIVVLPTTVDNGAVMRIIVTTGSCTIKAGTNQKIHTSGMAKSQISQSSYNNEIVEYIYYNAVWHTTLLYIDTE